jgi:hypothetical protein
MGLGDFGYDRQSTLGEQLYSRRLPFVPAAESVGLDALAVLVEICQIMERQFADMGV